MPACDGCQTDLSLRGSTAAVEIVTASELRDWYKRSYGTPYLAAAIKVSPQLARKLCEVRDELRRVDPRHVYSPSSYFHVTVKELGWLGAEVKEESLSGILNVFREVAAHQPPFELEVVGTGIFPSVVYGRVGVGAAEVRRMNAELARLLAGEVAPTKYDGVGMVPHVTLAHFAARDVGPLLDRAGKLATHFIGRMTVREIEVRKWYPHRLFEGRRHRSKLSYLVAGFELEGG